MKAGLAFSLVTASSVMLTSALTLKTLWMNHQNGQQRINLTAGKADIERIALMRLQKYDSAPIYERLPEQRAIVADTIRDDLIRVRLLKLLDAIDAYGDIPPWDRDMPKGIESGREVFNAALLINKALRRNSFERTDPATIRAAAASIIGSAIEIIRQSPAFDEHQQYFLDHLLKLKKDFEAGPVMATMMAAARLEMPPPG